MKASKKSELKELIKLGVVLQLVIIIVLLSMSALTIKTTDIAWQLFVASDNVDYAESQRSQYAPEGVHDFADDTYQQSTSNRQKLYDSEDGYTRWFSYTMGKTNGRRLLSLVIWALEFMLAAFAAVALYQTGKATAIYCYRLVKLQKGAR